MTHQPGDIITGQELADTRWKRGTIIIDHEQPGENLSLYVLRPSGRWYSNNSGYEYDFKMFVGMGAAIEIAYLP